MSESLWNALPEGQVVNRLWLKARGCDRPAVDYFLRSGRLVRVGRGFYRRPGPPLKWQHILYSLNELGYDLHVGGRTSLTEAGLTHYVGVSTNTRVDLYGCDTLPNWTHGTATDTELRHHGRGGYSCNDSLAIREEYFGTWDWPLPFSEPERALIEVLSQVRDDEGFRALDVVFESAISFRPTKVQEAVAACQSVKAKRLFCWFAERHQHRWMKHLDIDLLDFGSGKRQIIQGGRLNSKYQITVPTDMEEDHEEYLH